MRLLHVLCLLLVVPYAGLCQEPSPAADRSSPPKDKATVAGNVLVLDSGEPLKKARVTLQNRSDYHKSEYESTDEQGRFRFDGVEPGSYDLSVSRNGYIDSEFGEKRAGGPGAVLTLHAGQQVSDLVFRMSRAAAISGHVYDEDGEPIARAQVGLFRASVRGNRETQESEPVATNDLGEFRLFGLSPGRYLISVSYAGEGTNQVYGPSPKRGPSSGYLPSYYPNTTDPAKAQRIVIHAGDELRSVDFFLHPGPVVTVSGQVVIAPPNPAGISANVFIYPREPGVAQQVLSLNTFVDRKDGSFKVRGVPPGSYYVMANYMDSESRGWLGTRREVEVGGVDVEGLQLTIAPGSDIRGRLIWDGAVPREAQDAYVRLDPLDELMMGPTPQRVKPDGSFVLRNVAEGMYQPVVSIGGTSTDGFLKVARYGSSTVGDAGFTIHAGSDATLELVMSARPARVSGMVLTNDLLPAVGVKIVLIPDAPRRNLRRFYRSETTDQNGRFTLESVAPGDYKVFCWESAEDEDWTDQDWMKPYEGKGVAIHLEEGEQRTVELSVIEAGKDATGNP
jgi:protocatechuate 3,4-dioxygenase beta subunit